MTTVYSAVKKKQKQKQTALKMLVCSKIILKYTSFLLMSYIIIKQTDYVSYEDDNDTKYKISQWNKKPDFLKTLNISFICLIRWILQYSTEADLISGLSISGYKIVPDI